jgi:hypothetical protein
MYIYCTRGYSIIGGGILHQYNYAHNATIATKNFKPDGRKAPSPTSFGKNWSLKRGFLVYKCIYIIYIMFASVIKSDLCRGVVFFVEGCIGAFLRFVEG